MVPFLGIIRVLKYECVLHMHERWKFSVCTFFDLVLGVIVEKCIRLYRIHKYPAKHEQVVPVNVHYVSEYFQVLSTAIFKATRTSVLCYHYIFLWIPKYKGLIKSSSLHYREQSRAWFSHSKFSAKKLTEDPNCFLSPYWWHKAMWRTNEMDQN